MATEADHAAMRLYLSLMEEAKMRALSINTITSPSSGLPVSLAREYCFLQFRLLCELIALGCLTAHGDITNTKYFQREAYKADDILRALEKLHPDFYPVPVRPIFSPGRVHMELIESGFLTKPELVSLYGRCGDVLHKGSLDRQRRPPSAADFQDIQMWGQKILNLLSVHNISRLGGNFHMVTFLEHVDSGGNVHVFIAES